MSPKKQPSKSASCSASLTVPELDQSKTTVLNTLASAHSRRSYKHAIEKFIAWYCSEPRLGFNRSVVVRYRSFLEGLSLSAATINLHLSAIRRLADEAAESGWLSPELAIGIRRVKGVKRLGRRIGNWLTGDQAQELLNAVSQGTLRGRRDAAVIELLLGCGLRRSETVNLRLDQLQLRESHWVIVDMVGKGGRLRTVPVPTWCKGLVDVWIHDAGVTEGKVFRRVSKNGTRQDEANLSNPRGCVCNPTLRKKRSRWCQKVPLSSRLESRWYELRPRKAGGGAFPSPLPSHGETNLKDDVDG
jgi:site-specific recombinase XerC